MPPGPPTSADHLPMIGGAVAVAVLIAYAVMWIGVSPARQAGSDFSVDYVAAQLVRDGHGARLYDERLEAERHAALLPAGTVFDLPYIGPPTAALLALPLTAAGPQAAYRTWSLLQLALLAAAAALAARMGGWGRGPGRLGAAGVCLVALATPATLVMVLMGQWDGLLALTLAGTGAALAARRPATAGFILGLGFAATKPHLALGLAVFLLARGNWRAIGGAAGAAVLVVVTSLVVTGTGGIGAFARALGGALSNTPPQSTLGLAGLVSSWLGSGRLTAWLVIAGSVAALTGCAVLGRASRGPDRLAPTLAGATVLSLLVAPHLLGHDLALLVPAMVCFTAWYARHHQGDVRPPLAGWVALSCLVAVDAGNGAVAPPGRVVPWGLAALGALAIRQAVRTGAATGGGILTTARGVRPRRAS